MLRLPLDALELVARRTDESPFSTFVPCRMSAPGSASGWSVPFESDWPFERSVGKRLPNGMVAIRHGRTHQLPLLRPWLRGGNRQQMSDAPCGLLLLRDATSVYIFTDVFLYKYQRIGGLHPLRHRKRSALRCVCKEFAAIPPAFEETDMLFNVHNRIGPSNSYENLVFFAGAEHSQAAVAYARNFERRHRCDVEVVETSLQTIVVRQPRLVASRLP